MALSSIVAGSLALASTGSGDVAVPQLEATAVTAETSGSGDLSLAGAADSLDATTTGSGSILARDLVCVDVVALSSGSGDLELHATGSVDVTLLGSGDASVWGDPIQRSEHVTGSGEVVYHRVPHLLRGQRRPNPLGG